MTDCLKKYLGVELYHSRWVKPFLFLSSAFILGFLIRSLFLNILVMNGESMSPQLMPGDVVMASKLPYLFPELIDSTPKRNELVLLKDKESEAVLLRRTLAIKGDLVEINSGRLMINKQPVILNLNLSQVNKRIQFPFVMGSGEILAAANNPSNEPMEFERILADRVFAKPIIVIFSVNPDSRAPRWTRVFNFLN